MFWSLLVLVVCWWQAPLAGAAEANHLIISEVVVDVRPPASQFGSEFIEITNPTGESIDLSNVFLTDANTSPLNYYYNIVTGQDIGGGQAQDFHCRFPAGSFLAAGDTMVVSLAGTQEYREAYGRLPDFELFEDEPYPDAVPEMLEIFPGSVNVGLGGSGPNDPDLDFEGETVVLYRWDGQSDLVQDIDYLIWGSSQLFRVDKTGVAIDGPDPDGQSSLYSADTPVANQDPIPIVGHTFGQSFARLSGDEGEEIATGGNGITGHDETSEKLSQTWQITPVSGQDPPTEPEAWFPPAPIVRSVTRLPTVPLEDVDVSLKVWLLAFDGVAEATFFWSLDGITFQSVAATDNGDGTWTGILPGQDFDTEVFWYLTAVGTGGGTVVYPVSAPAFLESYTVAGQISLKVPARTFMPEKGETFPIQFVSQPDSETRLRIFDLEGRLQITLFDNRFDGEPSADPANPSELFWDGRDQEFERVAAGFYVVHLSVVDLQDGKEETKTAPVVVATPLSK
jgi:hypothetical protein